MAVSHKHHAARKLLKSDDRRNMQKNQAERNSIDENIIQSKKQCNNEGPLSWYDLTYSIL